MVVFVSVDVKGVADANFVSVDARGLSEKERLDVGSRKSDGEVPAEEGHGWLWVVRKRLAGISFSFALPDCVRCSRRPLTLGQVKTP
jgi:hypothetical protein